MTKKGISIIVCCYNSAARLPETLRHLAGQQLAPGISWEVLIVNNGSTDDTAEAALRFFEKNPAVRGRVLEEPVPGLSYARQKGFDNAAYEYVVLCDDDNWLEADYAQTAYAIMESDPQIAALGGFGVPAFETTPPPAWFNYYREYYATGPQSEQSGDISFTRSFVYGAGAVFNRDALQLLKQKGFENLLTDRKGTSLVTGGDNELGYALVLAGYKVWYDERLRFRHYMPAGRLTLSYFLKLAKWGAYSKFLLAPYTDIIHKATREKYKYSFAWNLMALLVLFIKEDLFALPRYILTNTLYRFKVSLAGRLGTLKAIVEYRGYQYSTLNRLKHASWYKNR